MIREDRAHSRYRLPFFIVLHPADGFDEMHYRQKGSYLMSAVFFLLLVFEALLSEQWIGRQIEMADKDSVDLIRTLLGRFAIVALFVIANWAFCILADGKATLGEVWLFTTYSLQPYIYAGLLRVLLSHVLTQDEGTFLSLLTVVGAGWSFLLLMTGMMIYHEYELGKAVLSFLVTLIGMLLIAFLAFLLYSLFRQVMDALLTIFNEIVFRIRQSR